MKLSFGEIERIKDYDFIDTNVIDEYTAYAFKRADMPYADIENGAVLRRDVEIPDEMELVDYMYVIYKSGRCHGQNDFSAYVDPSDPKPEYFVGNELKEKLPYTFHNIYFFIDARTPPYLLIGEPDGTYTLTRLKFYFDQDGHEIGVFPTHVYARGLTYEEGIKALLKVIGEVVSAKNSTYLKDLKNLRAWFEGEEKYEKVLDEMEKENMKVSWKEHPDEMEMINRAVEEVKDKPWSITKYYLTVKLLEYWGRTGDENAKNTVMKFMEDWKAYLTEMYAKTNSIRVSDNEFMRILEEKAKSVGADWFVKRENEIINEAKSVVNKPHELAEYILGSKNLEKLMTDGITDEEIKRIAENVWSKDINLGVTPYYKNYKILVVDTRELAVNLPQITVKDEDRNYFPMATLGGTDRYRVYGIATWRGTDRDGLKLFEELLDYHKLKPNFYEKVSKILGLEVKSKEGLTAILRTPQYLKKMEKYIGEKWDRKKPILQYAVDGLSKKELKDYWNLGFEVHYEDNTLENKEEFEEEEEYEL